MDVGMRGRNRRIAEDMGRSFHLGSWLGIGVYLHWTLFLIPASFFIYFALIGQMSTAVYLGMLFPLVYACVLLHEFGHALMARRFGIGTQDITMYPIGGVARLERMSDRPAEELWIAIAGPLVNLVIALVTLGVILFLGAERKIGLPDTGYPTASWTCVLGGLLFGNALLFAFNLLPAFPMDGGRVLRALLAMRLGLPQATEIAAGLGLVMSALFVCAGLLSVFGLMPCSPLLMLIGLFVGYAGQRELAAVRRSHSRRTRPEPLEVLPADDVVLAAPEGDFSGFTWDQQAGLWIQWRNGRPVHKICVEPE
jgi:Zn-dependent protease